MFPYVCLLFVALEISRCSGLLNTTHGNKTLVGVAVLFRHGDRSPIQSFPTDPYATEEYFPEGLGQLLKSGKKRHYDLGLFLRKRYEHFLPEEYSSKDIYVVSSDIDRTIMSAGANLAALYKPTETEIFQDGLPWRPIPVHTIPPEKDNKIAVYLQTCPAFDQGYNVLKDHYNRLQKFQYPEFYKDLSTLTGFLETNLEFFAIYDNLYVYKNYNVSYLPPWYDTLDKELLEYFAGRELAKETENTYLQRLRFGPFFTYLLNWFDGILEKKRAKFLMISGHDITVVGVLNSMGAFDTHPPDFTATVIWELYKYDNNSEFVNVYYMRNASAQLQPVIVRGCNFDCDYDEFKTILRPILIDDETWKQECGI